MEGIEDLEEERSALSRASRTDKAWIDYGLELNQKFSEATARLLSALEAYNAAKVELKHPAPIPDEVFYMKYDWCEETPWPRTFYFTVDGSTTNVPRLSTNSSFDLADNEKWVKWDLDRLKHLVEVDRVEALRDKLEFRLDTILGRSDKDADITDLMDALQDLDERLGTGDVSEVAEDVMCDDTFRPVDWLKIANNGFGGKFDPEECERMWDGLRATDVERSSWTEADKAALSAGVRKYGTGADAWEKISADFYGERTPLQCASYFHGVLDDRLGPDGSLDDFMEFLGVVENCSSGRIIDWDRVWAAYPFVPLKKLKAKYASLLGLIHFRKKGLKYSRMESFAAVAGLMMFGFEFDALSDLMGRRSAKSIKNHCDFLVRRKLGMGETWEKLCSLVTSMLEKTALIIEKGLEENTRNDPIGLTKRKLFDAFLRSLKLSAGALDKKVIFKKAAALKKPRKSTFLFPTSEPLTRRGRDRLRPAEDAGDVVVYIMDTMRHAPAMDVFKTLFLSDENVRDFASCLRRVLDWLEIPAFVPWERAMLLPVMPAAPRPLSGAEQSRWEIKLDDLRSFQKGASFRMTDSLPESWTMLPGKGIGETSEERNVIFDRAWVKISEAVLRAEVEKSRGHASLRLHEPPPMPPTVSTMVAYEIMHGKRTFRSLAATLRKNKRLYNVEEETVVPLAVVQPVVREIERPPELRTYTRKRKALAENLPSAGSCSGERNLGSVPAFTPSEANRWLQRTVTTLFSLPFYLSSTDIFDDSPSEIPDESMLWFADEEEPSRAAGSSSETLFQHVAPELEVVAGKDGATENLSWRAVGDDEVHDDLGWDFCIADIKRDVSEV